MKALYFDRIKHDATGYAKAFKTLELHIDRMPKTNDSALQDAVCKFGENSTNAVTAKTKKNGKKMNVQSTTVSRRVNVTRGRQAALRGAPRKGHTGPTREIDENGMVTEETEVREVVVVEENTDDQSAFTPTTSISYVVEIMQAYVQSFG